MARALWMPVAAIAGLNVWTRRSRLFSIAIRRASSTVTGISCAREGTGWRNRTARPRTNRGAVPDRDGRLEETGIACRLYIQPGLYGNTNPDPVFVITGCLSDIPF